ncbi:MAG: ABC transporter permease subunit [Helicobacteraceae bacterium]|nr:ABC transporter permease subunit [Helicobacteraceae bacterium]
MKSAFVAFKIASFAASIALIAVMAGICGFVLVKGAGAISLELIFGDADPIDALLGKTAVFDALFNAIAGTLFLALLSTAIAVVPAICAGAYIAEFATPKIRAALEFLVDLLAGVPSIVMGLFGYLIVVFLRKTFLPNANTSLLVAAIAIALLIMPLIARATKEALASLPRETRLLCACLALSKPASFRLALLPKAFGGVMGGVVLGLGRACEDTAVIMLTGAVIGAGFSASIFDKFEALPFAIYIYASEYRDENELAAAFGAALTLMALSTALIAIARLKR